MGRLIKEIDAMLAVQNAIMELGYDPLGKRQNKIYEAIEKVPTAYDKEKVIAELEKLADNSNDHMYESYFDGKEDGIRETIDIVKRGGVE